MAGLLTWARDNDEVRHQYVINWLRGIPAGNRLLDAGAGTQRYRPAAAHLHYVAQDFGNYEGGEEFGGRSTVRWDSTSCDILSDITAIPVPDESFDFVLCTEVFEHVPAPDRALKELSRIVKPGGEILVTAPFRSLYHQVPHFYYSGFSKFWYYTQAEQFQLDVVELVPNGTYYTDVGQEVIRIARLPRQPVGRALATLMSLPYVAFLLACERVFRVTAPESCLGYHCRLRKRGA